MARTYEITVYEKEDMEKLKDMTNEEVACCLERIARGWLPQNYQTTFDYDDESRTYGEDYYDACQLHIAINKAVQIVRKEAERGGKEG